MGKTLSKRRRGVRVTPQLHPAAALRHPGWIAAGVVAAGCIGVSVSFRLYDTDMWQHLAVGRAIWERHAFPTRQLWTWPTYGMPDVNASWGFRLVIWPIWQALGLPGLFAWRWVTTLAAFGLMWAAARRMGARGLSPLLVMVACSLVYRQRSQVRPETLVAVLLAAEIWILETWRQAKRRDAAGAAPAVGDPTSAPSRPPRDFRPWLVVIALVWANAHISYWMGLAVQFIYLLGDRASRDRSRGLFARWKLDGWQAPVAVLAASVAISLVNPWGWRALWQPFDYFLHWRHEAIYQTIGELQPVIWRLNMRNGLGVIAGLWVVLMAWRAVRFGFDAVELLLMGLFAALAFPTNRFVGFYALIAIPFLSRDLDAWVRTRHEAWPRRMGWRPLPVGARAALVAGCCVAAGIPEWSMPTMPPGVLIDWKGVPERACDFMEAHGVRGRGFNQFAAGGYLVYRFWPDRSRLPFMDIHQAGTREDRRLYAFAQGDSLTWRTLDAKYHFDYALLFTHQYATDHLIDFLDADTTRWALVFTDDAAALFVRRDGTLANLVSAFAYHRVPAGGAAYVEVMTACAPDSLLRADVEAGLRRAIAASPWNARAKSILALLRVLDERPADAERLLEEALSVDPLASLANEYLGVLALADGRPQDAMRHLKREARLFGADAVLDFEMARAAARLGDGGQARALYRRSLSLNPSNQATRDSLAQLEAGVTGGRP